ncbi:MAG: DKNYY domain-containing protein [Muribaculaceae bacterium]|nr:DKNYY domain-containing protein [Muribaculaceae bacterium]
MRKILFILAMVIGLMASVTSAQQRCDSHHEDRLGYEHRGRHNNSPYFVSENKVFFEGREINGTSPESFKVLRDGYAKDTWNTYYFGRKID